MQLSSRIRQLENEKYFKKYLNVAYLGIRIIRIIQKLLLGHSKTLLTIIGGRQELRREGWTETAVILCKLNKSL